MVPGHVNHSDDELAFLSFYPLLRYETDPALVRVYRDGLERSWLIERPERNPLWNVIYAAGTGAFPKADVGGSLMLLFVLAVGTSLPSLALAAATAAEAHFIRVNVHMGAVVSEQGLIQGMSHETLRLRASLKSTVLIFADVGVKHAAPLADRGLTAETKDLAERGLADAIIVSGELTGAETKTEDVEIVRVGTTLPLLIGSGATPENIHRVYGKVDGFIVGSYFKKDGRGESSLRAGLQTLTRFLTKFSIILMLL